MHVMTSASCDVPMLAFGFTAPFTDTRALGEATLIAIAAIVVGVLVRRFWPKGIYPVAFGILAGLGLIAGLAALGVPTAGLMLWLAIAAAAVLLALAFYFN